MSSFLTMRNICKTYSLTGTIANDDVSFEVRRGEIHALVGENGAGKTTLMKILYGLEHPDSGKIQINGEDADIHSAAAADKLGIGMVHQHFKLINDFTVAQNIVLGAEPVRHHFVFDNSAAEARVKKIIDNYHFTLPVKSKAANLSAGQKQQAEIIRLLYRNSSILILDEPTSVLTEKEVEDLFNTLRKLRESGRTIILITHKLSEVKKLSDRITVMRKGRIVRTAETADVDEREISKLMVGEEISLSVEKSGHGCREPVLELENVKLEGKDHEQLLLDNVSFSVSSCEVLGITAAAGNGLMELEDVLAGIRSLTGGRIYFDGKDVSSDGFCALRRRGMAYVPSDRLHRGVSLESSLAENLIVLKRKELSGRFGYLSTSRVEEYSGKLVEEYGIKGRVAAPAGVLSGGNIQKAVLARELENISGPVLFAEPTWGLDITAGMFIYKKILSMKASGSAVLLLSSNIDEITALSDRIMVMYKGRIVTDISPSEYPSDKTGLKELVGEYLMGLKDDYERR